MAVASMLLGILGAFIIMLNSASDVRVIGSLGFFLGWGADADALLGADVLLSFLVACVGALASMAAIIGAILAKNNPKVGAIIMLASVIPGALALNPVVYFGGMLLIIASALAFLTYRRQQSQPEPTP